MKILNISNKTRSVKNLNINCFKLQHDSEILSWQSVLWRCINYKQMWSICQKVVKFQAYVSKKSPIFVSNPLTEGGVNASQSNMKW